MKGEKLMDALGRIDEELIASAMPSPRQPKRSPWPVIAAAVAAVLMVGVIWMLLPGLSREDPLLLAGEIEVVPEQDPAPILLPTLPDEFPATVSEAVERGIPLQTGADRNMISMTLPVFARAGESPAPDYAAMKALAREIGGKLGMTGEPVRYGKTVSLTDGHSVTVDSAMTAEILLETPLALPAAYDLTTYDGAYMAAAWLRADALRDVDMTKLHTEVVDAGEAGWEIRVCDEDRESRWYEIDTGALRLTLGKDGVEKVVLRSLDVVSSLGEYPIYNIREARDRVMAGCGYFAGENPPETPVFHAMGLVYLEFESTEVSAPFYWFAAMDDQERELLWFLPAVQEQYLKVKYRWKDMEFVDIGEKLRYLPAGEEISEEARRAFADFMVQMQVDDDYLDFDMYFSVSGDQIILRCHGPLMVTTGLVETFLYDTGTGTVSLGSSGVWEEQPYDAAEGIRRMLLQRTGDRQYAGYNYDQCVREAFVLYFMENPTLLSNLPVFNEQTPVNWEDLLLFAVLNTDLGDDFTEAELEAAVGTLLDGVTYTHGSGSVADYVRGIYHKLAFGLGDNPIYYRPEMAYWDADDNVWEMVLTGYEFSAEDFFLQTEVHSQNWEIFSRWAADHQDLNEEALVQFFDAAILECLYSDAVTPETVGLQPSQYLTVRFRLQEGGCPMQFVSCSRVVACGQ